MKYEAHIISFVQKPGRFNGVDYLMSDGTRSDLKQDANEGDQPWQEVRISPADAEVRKIVMHETTNLLVFNSSMYTATKSWRRGALQQKS